MPRRARILFGLALSLLLAPQAKAGFTYTTFDVPGATQGTFALGLNGAGAVVGYYSEGPNANHGFLRDPAGNLTTLDFPKAKETEATGITSSGQIVGFYNAGDSSPNHGFLLSGGKYTSIDVPGSTQTAIV